MIIISVLLLSPVMLGALIFSAWMRWLESVACLLVVFAGVGAAAYSTFHHSVGYVTIWNELGR